MRCAVLATALLLTLPAAAGGQEPEDEAPVVRGLVGGAAQYGRATGEFASYVRDGGGLNGWLAVRLGRSSPLALRIGGHFLIYGSQTRRYPLVPGVSVDVTTSNNIAGLLVGPQLIAGEGRVSGYAFGGVGFNYFATTSSVEGSNNLGSFASSTNFDDITAAAEAGGGLMVRLGRSVFLDLGARYVLNGEVTYVTRDRIQVTNNQLQVSPVTSQANLAIYHLGISAAVRPRRPRDRDGRRD